jgi:large subunit ribosomal protein L18e
MKRTGSTNKYLKELISELKKLSIDEKVAIWKRVAVDLEKPTRQRRVVNLSTINRNTKEGEIIVIPGKVLGTGNVEHKLTVAAQSFSDSAKKLIENSSGKAITIKQLVKDNPKGKNVRIIG